MCKNLAVRINTDGRYEWRIELYDDTADILGESTRSKAIDTSAEFTQQIIPALERAVEHEDMTPALAKILSTSVVDVEYEVSTGVNVNS